MRRKSVLAILLVVLVLLVVGTTLVLLLKHEPSFYAAKALEPGVYRSNQSTAFEKEFWRLFNDIGNDREEWQATFTETQLNAFFDERFVQSGLSDKLLPEGVSAPRIAIEGERIRLAFRYGTPPWSTIISLDFRVWMASKEPNVVALEMERLRAGALPISAQCLLEPVIEAARRQNIEVTWYRHNGNPVALFKFLSNRARPTAQLHQLAIHDSSLSIVGRSLESTLHIMSAPTLPRGN